MYTDEDATLPRGGVGGVRVESFGFEVPEGLGFG